MPEVDKKHDGRVVHDKLVRDRIPVIIRDSGSQPTMHTLEGDAYKQALLAKLIEEALELQADCGYEERADIAEVLRAIDEEFGFSVHDIETARRDKADKRGAFRDKIFLEYVDEN